MLMEPRDGRIFQRSFSARVGSDGLFATAALPPGRYAPIVETLFPGWTLKSILLAGRAAAGNRIEVRTGDVEDVELLSTDRAPEINGVVKDKDGKARPDVTVLAFPTDRTLWKDFAMTPQRLVRVRPNRQGAYVVSGLQPGDFWLRTFRRLQAQRKSFESTRDRV